MRAPSLWRSFRCVVSTFAPAILLAVAAQAGPPAAVENGPAIGTQAPAFELPDLQGKLRKLAEIAVPTPRPVVLNFWAFWCDTWRDELPHLEALAARQKDLGFGLVAVSIDGTRMPEFEKHAPKGLQFPVLLDPRGKVTAEYSVHRVPTVVVIDAKGAVRYVASGYPGNQAVLNWIRKLTGAGAASDAHPAKPARAPRSCARRWRTGGRAMPPRGPRSPSTETAAAWYHGSWPLQHRGSDVRHIHRGLTDDSRSLTRTGSQGTTARRPSGPVSASRRRANRSRRDLPAAAPLVS